MNKIAIIEHLVFKRGGVTGAIRRLVYRWRGVFSVTLIKAALARRYPLLVPQRMIFYCRQLSAGNLQVLCSKCNSRKYRGERRYIEPLVVRLTPQPF